MFYICTFLIIVYFSFMNGFLRKKENISFLVIGLSVAIITSLRYGLGTDYFGYQFTYNYIPSNFIKTLEAQDEHFEIGFRVIMSLFKFLDYNFETFVMFITIVIFMGYIYVIWKKSNYKILSFLIVYSLYYEVYISSALRQGLGMVIFFIAYYKFIENKEYKRYIVSILIGSLFHKTILIGLIIPIICKLYKKNFYNVKLNIILVFASITGLLLRADRIIYFMLKFIGSQGSVSTQSSISIYPIAIRVLMIIAIYILYKTCNESDISEFDKIQIYTYFIGVIIYISISNISMFSRVVDILTMVEIIIIPNLISKSKIKQVGICIVPCYMFVLGILFIKDINASLYQGNYYNKELLNYPYVSVFNKSEIFNFRPIGYDID